MKSVIVREVRALVFRLPASTAAQAAPSTPAIHTHIRFTDADSSSSKPKPAAKSDKDKGPEARWNSHAWYYSAVTLNQIVLTPSATDRVVARTLVDTYFEMFEEILGSKVNDDGASDDEAPTDAKGKKGKGKYTPKGKKDKKKSKKRKTVKDDDGPLLEERKPKVAVVEEGELQSQFE